MPRTQTKSALGFTLIEVLVISPLVILFIGAFVALIINLTGDSLRLRESNTAAYNVQDALDDIEATANSALGFMSTTADLQDPLPAPLGSNTGISYGYGFDVTDPFTNYVAPNTERLIIKSAATTKKPSDPTREVIYTGSGACNSQNPIYTYMTVYFISNKTLYKRTIVPGKPACKTPWQKNTCSEIYVEGEYAGYFDTCYTSDEKLLDNVENMDITYYATPSSTTPLPATDPEAATSVSVSIQLSKPVAGEQVNYTGSVRASSSNVQPDTGSSQVADANISWSRNPATPYTTDFTWDPVGNADEYRVSYRINGGGSYYSAGIKTSPAASIAVTARKQSLTVDVYAHTPNGWYLYGTETTTPTPNWNDCSYQNGWTTYGAPYGVAGFTKTSAGVVSLNGLIKKATAATAGEIICTLPPGFRPSGRLIFAPATGGTTVARVDIDTNGNVIYYYGNIGWVSLNGISFLASGTRPWTNMTGSNSWTAYGSVYPAPQTAVDSTGRVHVQGLAAGGGTTAGTVAFTYASAIGAMDGLDIWPARSTAVGSMMITNSKTIQYRGSGGNGYWSLQAMFYPSGTTTWTTPALAAGWVSYSATPGYNTAQYTKNSDGIVSLRGLIKGGTVASGTVLFTLPSGYRPSDTIICSEVTNPDAFARVDVATNGQVILREGVNAGWLSLAGCDFPVD